MTSEQLELGFAPPARSYVCCGQPAPAIGGSAYPDFPHAEDCANPSIGAWIDRWGRPLRRLWCSDTARMGGACPYVGDRARFRPVGGCCKDLRDGARPASSGADPPKAPRRQEGDA